MLLDAMGVEVLDMENIYSVKNVKTFRGEDGLGFACTLYRGNKRIAYVVDPADGSFCRWDWFNEHEEHDFDKYCKSLPLIKSEYGDYHPTWDIVVTDLANEYEENRTLKAKCKRRWVVRLKGDEPYNYHSWEKEMYRRSAIEKHFGDKIVEFVNDRFEK